MRVIRPSDVSPNMLVSSNIVELQADYSAGTSYALNSRVVYNGVIYECILGPSLGNAPPTSPLYWTNKGPSNLWAMFDRQISTASTALGTLTVTIATGMIDSVALIAVEAYTANITLRDGPGGPIVYEDTLSFSGDIATDWYQHFFFDPTTARSTGVISGLPPYQSTHLTLTLTGDSTLNVGIGALVFGLSSDIGTAEYGASAGITDYSRKVTNLNTGLTTFAVGAFAKRLSVNLEIETRQLNRIQRLLYGLRATPCVWLASDNPEMEEALVLYGFYKDFTTVITYATASYCSLEIEGLV